MVEFDIANVRTRVRFPLDAPRYGELLEWLLERFAKPSLRKGRIGSNPILSSSFKSFRIITAIKDSKLMTWVRFPLPFGVWCSGSTLVSKHIILFINARVAQRKSAGFTGQMSRFQNSPRVPNFTHLDRRY